MNEITRAPHFIPYGRQWIDEEDVAAVVEALRSDWLTTGPLIERFESAIATIAGSAHAVAVSSGTAALHAAMYSLGIGPGDEVIVPAISFAATANCVVFQGGTPVFADVLPSNLLINPASVEASITTRTKAIIAVDYAGHPCQYDELRCIADQRDLYLVDDACHALGGAYRERPVGSLADLSTFSFHPVKHITTGEGGAITTNDAAVAKRLRLFRNHGISTDHRQRAHEGSWFYEMVDLGYNYRLSDIQSALGLSQLPKLPKWVARRQEIARRYRLGFASIFGMEPLDVSPDVSHAYHLFSIRIQTRHEGLDRASIYKALRESGVGVNVHYIPIYLHPYYRSRFGTAEGLCPVAEAAYQELLTLPMFPAMRDEDVDFVLDACASAVGACQQNRLEVQPIRVPGKTGALYQ